MTPAELIVRVLSGADTAFIDLEFGSPEYQDVQTGRYQIKQALPRHGLRSGAPQRAIVRASTEWVTQYLEASK